MKSTPAELTMRPDTDAGLTVTQAQPPGGTGADAPEHIWVVTHAPNHPHFASWIGLTGVAVEYAVDPPIDYVFPANTALVVTFDCYREPHVTLLRRAMEAQIPVLLLADGILEYRNTFEHPQLVSGSLFQPVLAHKIACLGRSQARVIESWDNHGKCEVVGAPRLDRYCSLKRRAPGADAAFRVLVMTAITPYFTDRHRACVVAALKDVAAALQDSERLIGRKLEPVWRLTKGLAEEIGVASQVTDLTGRELAEVLQGVDAVITTPSTSMLEAMLLGLPVAALDYTNSPQYVQTAWQITAMDHVVPVLKELVNPPPPKLQFQSISLHDSLECTTPSAPRLAELAGRMIEIGRQAKREGSLLRFPARVVPLASDFAPTNGFDLATYFPDQGAFQQADVRALQVEVAHLRDYCAQLEQAAARLCGPDSMTQSEAALAWRAKLLAGMALAEARHREPAIRMLLDAVKSVERCNNPLVSAVALCEISAALGPLDHGRATYLAGMALKMADNLKCAELVQRVKSVVAGMQRPRATSR